MTYFKFLTHVVSFLNLLLNMFQFLAILVVNTFQDHSFYGHIVLHVCTCMLHVDKENITTVCYEASICFVGLLYVFMSVRFT